MWTQFIEQYNINHASAVVSFTNGKSFELLTDSQLLAQLNESIESYSYNAAIFNHPQFEKLLFTLFYNQRINWLQICTEIERFELRKLESTIYCYPLLNEAGTGFSNDAKEMLLPQLIYKKTGAGKFSNKQLTLLLDMCKKFPRSEQYFLVCLHNDLVMKENTSSASIVNTLDANESIFTVQTALKKRFLFLSFSLKNAIGLAIYQQQWFAHLGLVGKLNKEDIEIGIKKQIRYTSLPFYTYQDLGKVHDYEDVSLFTLIMHDYYHSRVCSSIPSPFHKAMNHIIDSVRSQIAIKWTLALWLLTDREFKYFFYNHEVDYNTISFGCFLDYGTGGESLQYQSGGLFVASHMTRKFGVHLNISDIGILTFLDMAKNKLMWDNMGIRPDELKHDYSHHYTYADAVKNDLLGDFSLDILLYRIFVLLKDLHKFSFVKKIILNNINFWKAQLKYTDISKNTQASIFKGVKYKNDLLEKRMTHVMHDILFMAIHEMMPSNEYEHMNAINIEPIEDSVKIDIAIDEYLCSDKSHVTKLFFLNKLLIQVDHAISQAKIATVSFSWTSIIKINPHLNKSAEKINTLANDIFSSLTPQQREIMLLIPMNFEFKQASYYNPLPKCSIM
jgi:hypothetical protein